MSWPEAVLYSILIVVVGAVIWKFLDIVFK